MQYTHEIRRDPDKAALNHVKHGIRFANAVTALEDDSAITIHDQYAQEEERWITLGMDSLQRLLVVIYTWRDERIRIISARHATRRERHQYEENDEE